jgi:hypothetical protein
MQGGKLPVQGAAADAQQPGRLGLVAASTRQRRHDRGAPGRRQPQRPGANLGQGVLLEQPWGQVLYPDRAPWRSTTRALTTASSWRMLPGQERRASAAGARA